MMAILTGVGIGGGWPSQKGTNGSVLGILKIVFSLLN